MEHLFLELIFGFIGSVYLWIKSGFRKSYLEIIEKNELIETGKYLTFSALTVIMIILVLGSIVATIFISVAFIFS